MNNLKDALVDYCKVHIDPINEWYSWRAIDEKKLPSGINLPQGNQYTKNLALKWQLHEKWSANSNNEDRLNLTKYYIATWGGIHSNGFEKLIEYSMMPADQLIAKGRNGIASWSKALVLHNPSKYAIYDARVAISINCLQKLYGVKNKMCFPLLSSRNRKVAKGNLKFKKILQTECWSKSSDNAFYNQYLEILNEVKGQLDTDISTIEMLLFAKAEELVIKVFGNH